MQESLTNLLHTFGLAFWVEITTETPRCTYYFGPFFSRKEAETEKSGYIEDLEQEGAIGIQVSIQRCKPEVLTIFDDVDEVGEAPSQRVTGALSSQFQ
jgi:hypothetical protein